MIRFSVVWSRGSKEGVDCDEAWEIFFGMNILSATEIYS